MILDLEDDAFRSVFRKTKLRIRVVVVEYVFDAERPERQRNQENVVGRVTTLDYVKSAPNKDPPTQYKLPE